ncbi:MAG TPA: hypothetical protein VGH76_06120 [Actinomycetospora sp.]|jgi:hypothetical protein|uniref:hypothetical protein n=1 Tax=Actinomycetospora sp. TaxID=1872135 RepID=UPI002F414FA4
MPLPGDPEAVEEACRQLGVLARSLQAAGESVAGHGRAITADWTGLAAPLALARTQQDATNVQRVAEAVGGSVGPLSRFAEELRTAQRDYAGGESMVGQGRVAVSGLPSEAAPAADAARDRAGQATDDGAALMRTAEERARVANQAAARILDAASSSLAGIAPAPSTRPAAATTSPLAELGNSVASLGNAALEYPLDVLGVVGGSALTAVSAAGVVGSLALDGTGVGAIAGVPLGGASVAVVAGGVGLAGAGLLDLATHAATDSRVAPFQVDHQTEPIQGPAPSRLLRRSWAGRGTVRNRRRRATAATG